MDADFFGSTFGRAGKKPAQGIADAYATINKPPTVEEQRGFWQRMLEGVKPKPRPGPAMMRPATPYDFQRFADTFCSPPEPRTAALVHIDLWDLSEPTVQTLASNRLAPDVLTTIRRHLDERERRRRNFLTV
jgi:hypothetical protein